MEVMPAYVSLHHRAQEAIQVRDEMPVVGDHEWRQ